MSKYFTRDRRPKKEDFLEVNSGEIKVETAGYIPIHLKIEKMQECGIRLKATRDALYDYGEGGHINDSEISVDPTRRYGIDYSEIYNLQRSVSARMEESKKVKQMADQEKDDKKVSKEPKKPKDFVEDAEVDKQVITE